MRFLSTFIFILVLTLSSFGQEQEGVFSPNFINYSIESGLPSNEVYHVYSDRNGIIWIATDQGVCRYNGQEMELFTMVDGLTDNVVFKFFEDHLGRMWCSTANHKLCYFENDSIHPYKYNDVILQNVANNTINISIVVDLENNVHLGYNYNGYFKISNEGILTRFGSDEESKGVDGGIFIKPIMNEVLTFYFYSKLKQIPSSNMKSKRIISMLKSDANEVENKFEVKSKSKYLKGVSYGCRISDFSLAVLDAGRPFRIHDGRMETYDINNGAGIFISSIGDEVWIGTKLKGVFVFDSNTTLTDRFLEKYSVSSVCQDREGGYWFSTLENGVFYSSTRSIRSYKTSTAGPNSLSIASGLNEEVYVGTSFGEVSRFKPKGVINTYTLEEVNFSNEILALFVDDNKVYCSASIDFIIDLTNDKVVVNDQFFAEKHLLMHENGELYSVGMSRIGVAGKEFLDHQLRVNAIEQYKEGIVLACSDGLYYFDNKEISKIEFNSELSGHHIMGVKACEKGLYVITKSGTFGKLDEKGVFEQIDFGYDMRNYYDINISNDNELWLSGDRGIIRTTVERPEQFSLITKSDGLPSGLIRQIEFTENYVWFLTSAGPTWLHKDELRLIVPKAKLREVSVNNEMTEIKKHLVFPHNLNQLEFKYFAETFRNSESIVYKYILENEDVDTVFTSNQSVRYPSLNPGRYKFSVSASFDGVHFSENTSLTFIIKKPFWFAWWFVMLEIVTAAMLLYFIFNYRVKVARKKLEVKRQLVELRSQALRAQMNPHFTFNALNSIQSLIASDKNDEAAIYLAEFSDLMRNALEASSTDTHSLEEELRIIKQYLALEKLRFKEVIIYQIDVDAAVNPTKIHIPPMIIQPLVENSIIHGLLPKKEEGSISIRIRLLGEDEMEICVEDNGVGTKQSYNANKPAPKGINLIEERLKLNNFKNSIVVSSPVKDEIGFKAIIKIYLKKNNLIEHNG